MMSFTNIAKKTKSTAIVPVGFILGMFLFVQVQTGEFAIHKKPSDSTKTGFMHGSLFFECEQAIDGTWRRTHLFSKWTWEPDASYDDIKKACRVTGAE